MKRLINMILFSFLALLPVFASTLKESYRLPFVGYIDDVAFISCEMENYDSEATALDLDSADIAPMGEGTTSNLTGIRIGAWSMSCNSTAGFRVQVSHTKLTSVRDAEEQIDYYLGVQYTESPKSISYWVNGAEKATAATAYDLFVLSSDGNVSFKPQGDTAYTSLVGYGLFLRLAEETAGHIDGIYASDITFSIITEE